VAKEIRRDLVRNLDQPALQADLRVQRKRGLLPVQFIGADKHIRRGVLTHRQEQIWVFRLTGSAMGEFIHHFLLYTYIKYCLYQPSELVRKSLEHLMHVFNLGANQPVVAGQKNAPLRHRISNRIARRVRLAGD
jgi:hypothetical protein